jgi:hypothetical protein
MMGQDEEALVWLRRAAAASPETPIILAALTSQLALAGKDAEAHATLAQYLALPSTRTRIVAQWEYVPDDSPAFAKIPSAIKERAAQGRDAGKVSAQIRHSSTRAREKLKLPLTTASRQK